MHKSTQVISRSNSPSSFVSWFSVSLIIPIPKSVFPINSINHWYFPNFILYKLPNRNYITIHSIMLYCLLLINDIHTTNLITNVTSKQSVYNTTKLIQNSLVPIVKIIVSMFSKIFTNVRCSILNNSLLLIVKLAMSTNSSFYQQLWNAFLNRRIHLMPYCIYIFFLGHISYLNSISSLRIIAAFKSVEI